MPTNDYQKLVKIVEEALHSKKAKILESVQVQPLGLEEDREIDVLVEEDVGPYKMKIALEATDLGEKLGLAKFDSLCQKYTGPGRVAVDKFVIVTRRGYTSGVEEKAKLLGVELVTLDTALDGKTDVFSSTPPHVCLVAFEPAIPATAVELMEKAKFRLEEGEMHSVLCVAHRAIRDLVLPKTPTLFREMGIAALKSEKRVHHQSYEFGLNEGATIIFNDIEYPVRKMTVRLHQGAEKSGERTELDRVSSQNGAAKIIHMKSKMGEHFTLEYAQPIDAKQPRDMKLTISRKLINEMLEQAQKANPGIDVPKLVPKSDEK